jgi:hypothetical protein
MNSRSETPEIIHALRMHSTVDLEALVADAGCFGVA